MIKWDDLKYQWYGPEVPEVLFDLAADPAERRNAIADSAYANRVQQFRKRRDELGYGSAGSEGYINAGY
jgi:choline-sulfatase